MRQFLHKIHLWAGLILCVPLVLLGLSGSLLVFQHELHDFFAPPHASTAGTPHSVCEILDAANDEAPKGFAPIVYRPAIKGGMASVFLTPASYKNVEGGKRVQMLIDPVSLAVADKNASGGFMRQILQFHSSLMLRDYGGRSVVGWFGVVMVMFGSTGLVLWWPRKGQWRNAFKASRKSRGWKLFRELHGAAGIWSAFVLIIVSSSGVYLAFPQTMNMAAISLLSARDIRAPPSMKMVPIEGREVLDADRAIKLAHDAVPDSKLVSVMLPTKPEQPYRITFMRANASDNSPSINVYVDPWQNLIIETRDPQNYSAGETVIAWLHAVHAGQAFGDPWRILVFTAGLMPLFFAFTGISMWAIKRRSA